MLWIILIIGLIGIDQITKCILTNQLQYDKFPIIKDFLLDVSGKSGAARYPAKISGRFYNTYYCSCGRNDLVFYKE